MLSPDDIDGKRRYRTLSFLRHRLLVRFICFFDMLNERLYLATPFAP